MAKILLVEDDINLGEIYQARMEAEGYEVVAASDGETALALAAKEKPDLIISDVMMPKISGFEMLDILRNTDGLKQTRVIMLTALGQAEDKTRADSLGADKYLVKSQVTLEDIVSAAKELLGETDDIAEPVAPAAPAAVPEPVAVVPAPVQEAPSEPLAATEPAELPAATPAVETATETTEEQPAIPEVPVSDTEPAPQPAYEPQQPDPIASVDPIQPQGEPIVADQQPEPQAVETPDVQSVPAPEVPQTPATEENVTAAYDATPAAQTTEEQAPLADSESTFQLAEPVQATEVAPVEPAYPQPALETAPQIDTPPEPAYTTSDPIEPPSIEAAEQAVDAALQPDPNAPAPEPTPALPPQPSSEEPYAAPVTDSTFTAAITPDNDPALQPAAGEVAATDETADTPVTNDQPTDAPQTAAQIDDQVVSNAVDELLAKSGEGDSDYVPNNDERVKQRIIAPIPHPPQPSLDELLAKEEAKEAEAEATGGTDANAAAPSPTPPPMPLADPNSDDPDIAALGKAQAEAAAKQQQPNSGGFDASKIAL